ncbi:MAG: DUF1349 domain-containing protein [Brevinematales bacterium]|nr:DUF1349 domain-containing protein [Brevinematales bacterium]
MEWLNPPAHFSGDNGVIKITTLPKTDFWRVTHYDFTKQNAHFYHRTFEGDFEISVKVSGAYRDNYDQAGLMILADDLNWIKAGIEFTDGIQNISAVITREFSDWSVQALNNAPESVWFRIIRRKESVEAAYSIDGENYCLYRLGYLSLNHALKTGIYAASPMGDGFPVTFEQLSINPL